MKLTKNYRRSLIIGSTLLLSGLAFASPESLQQSYQDTGAGPFSAEAGASAWQQEHPADKAPLTRSCSNCHGTDLSQPGKHAKTGKTIKPMSPSSNAERLTDSKKVEKWFRRNCRWTLGRECTPQEKGDFISYINQN